MSPTTSPNGPTTAQKPPVSILANISQLARKDVVAIFGKTKAGKSTFINDLYGDNILHSTGSLLSGTNVMSYIDKDLEIGSCAIRLVDTIGLGGSEHEHNTLHLSNTWIKIFRNGNSTSALNPTVKWIVYFIDIADRAGLDEANQKNLRFFKTLVGPNVLKSVFFVTTQWTPRLNRVERRNQDRRFLEWKEKLGLDKELPGLDLEFPGAHLLKLDYEIPRPDDEESGDEITRERAVYRASLERLLLEKILPHPATQPTQTEEEINGGEKSLGQTSLGKLAKAQVEKDVQTLVKAGNNAAANELQQSLEAFSAIQLNTIKFTIKTVHGKTVPITLFSPNNAIEDCKRRISTDYGLPEYEQYYSGVPQGMPGADESKWLKFTSPSRILSDTELIANNSILLLRIDTYLTENEIKAESNKVIEAGTEDMLGPFHNVVTPFLKLFGNIGVGAADMVLPTTPARKLRMWKRADRERTKKKGFFGQAIRNAGSFVRNSYDLITKTDLTDKQVEEVYKEMRLLPKPKA